MQMQTNTQLAAPLRVNETPLDYLVSTTLATGVVTGALNYDKVKKGDMDKKEAIKDTIKLSSQAGIATGATIAAIQYGINKNYLSAFLSIGAGVGGVMAIEKICKSEEEIS